MSSSKKTNNCKMTTEYAIVQFVEENTVEIVLGLWMFVEAEVRLL